MRRLSDKVSCCVRPLSMKDCMMSGFSSLLLESGSKRSAIFSSAMLKTSKNQNLVSNN
jgi:hypothetical protein